MPDSTLVLPILLTTAYLVNMELAASRAGGGPKNKIQMAMTGLFRVVSVGLVRMSLILKIVTFYQQFPYCIQGVWSAYLPSVLGLFWTTSALAAISNNLLLIHPKFRLMEMRFPSFNT